jgi:hypothetical protein
MPGWDYTENFEYDWLEDEDESTRRDFFNATGDYDEQEERIYFKNNQGNISNIKDYILSVDDVTILNEKKNKDPFGINAYALELAKGLEEEINKKEYTIYSDMDGVLVDFNNRFKRFSKGIHPIDFEAKYGKDKFWELIDGIGVRFWVGMDWMSDGKQLWNYIKKYNPLLLSSPSRADHSRMGKRIWRKRNLPSTKLILAQAIRKQNYATPNSILIDDYESNIDQWVKAGGIGILHTDTASTIKKLKELGL